jgi:hypothetical protein
MYMLLGAFVFGLFFNLKVMVSFLGCTFSGCHVPYEDKSQRTQSVLDF